MERIELSKKRMLEYVSLRKALTVTRYKREDLIKEEIELYDLGHDEYCIWCEAIRNSKPEPSAFLPPIWRAFFNHHPEDVLEFFKDRALDGGLMSMLEAYDFGVSAEDIIA